VTPDEVRKKLAASLEEEIDLQIEKEKQRLFSSRDGVDSALKALIKSSGRADLLYYFKDLPEECKDQVYDILRARLQNPTAPRGEFEKVIWEPDYEEQPISIEEFLQSKYHIGKWYYENIFPKWKEEITQVINKGCIEWVLGGSIGCGKCVEASTLINTDEGFATIRDVYWGNTLGPDTCSAVQAESGVREIQQVHDEGVTETRRLRTKHGHVLEGRPNHRVRVLGPDLSLSWKTLGEIEPGDCVLEQPATVFGKTDLPSEVAELLGWFIAEGVREEGSPKAAVNTARLHLHDDEIDYVEQLARRAAEFLQADVSVSREYRYVSVTGGRVRDVFPSGTSKVKTVPDSILTGTRETICAFLRGFFSGDGHSGPVECSAVTVSQCLAEQVRVLLTSLGMYCSLTTSTASYRLAGERIVTGDKYLIRILGPDSLKQFAEEIGFAQESKQQALIEFATRWSPNSDHSFAFKLSAEQLGVLRELQPRYKPNELPDGVNKRTSPRGLLHRLAKQGCTVRLLRQVEAAGGFLPGPLHRVATGQLLFDTVESVEVSEGHCYDLTVSGDPSYISGGFVSHNTTAAMLITLYKVYVVSCMKDPCGFYTATSIVFGFFSITKDLSKDVEANMLRTRLMESEYFRRAVGMTEEVDDPRRPNAMIFKFPKNIKLVFGSRALHALGQDVFGGIMDEVAFDTSSGGRQVIELYNSIKSRIKSRYMTHAGRVPGILCISSSADKEGDFIDKHMKDAQFKDKTHISSFALYQMKPYSGPTFRVLVGDQSQKSKLLDRVDVDMEQGSIEVVPVDEAPEGFRVENVPVHYWDDYELDIEKALKDISGIPLFSASPFFPNRQKIFQLIDENRKHPFSVDEPILTTADDDYTLESLFDREALFVKPDPYENRFQMRINPGTPRFFHVDLAKSQDSAGLACVHLFGSKKVLRIGQDGRPGETYLPYVYVDFMVRLRPPAEKGEEIDFSKIVSFIFYLQQLGCPIGEVTFDRYQSSHSIQLFKKQHIESREISMDITPAPYLTLQSAFNAGCISYYRYPTFLTEATRLQKDPKTGKGDHPIGGSKDVLDAVTGAHYACLMSKSTEMQMAAPHLIVRGITPPRPTAPEVKNWAAKDYKDFDSMVDIFDDSLR